MRSVPGHPFRTTTYWWLSFRWTWDSTSMVIRQGCLGLGQRLYPDYCTDSPDNRTVSRKWRLSVHQCSCTGWHWWDRVWLYFHSINLWQTLCTLKWNQFICPSITFLFQQVIYLVQATFLKFCFKIYGPEAFVLLKHFTDQKLLY